MKRILGYTDPWSAAPGDTVAVHVHTDTGAAYRLDVVRVVSGDADGLGLDLRPVPSPIDGMHQGRPQQTRLGSAMLVDHPPVLPPGAALELSLWIWPTTHLRGRQGLIDWASAYAGGLALEIGSDGHALFRMGDALVRSPRPLPERRWTRLVARHDPGRGRISLELQTRSGSVAERDLETAAEVLTPAGAPGTGESPLLLAALGGAQRYAHFNGKIASPEIRVAGALRARWDFRPGHPGPTVPDLAGSHTGRLLNLPARAVTGPDWTGDVHDWRAAPDQYDAIHFHDDDLYDAEWDVAHQLRIPEDWPSGYHAVRLQLGDDTCYLPLFVRPLPGKATAPLAVLASTLTSIAYANYRFHLDVDSNEASLGRVTLLSPEDVLLCESRELGLSTYDLHLDGSPVRHASRLRPVVNNWPGGEVWNLNADTHILAWLDRLGQPFDLITDEDLHREGAELLSQYRAVLAGSHPEYWTTPMWDGLSTYLGQGGRLLYFGGNGFYWRTAMSSDWPGAIEIRRAEGGGRYTAEEPGHHHCAFTGELHGLWRRSGRPPNALVGVGTRGIGFDGIGHFRRTPQADDPRVSWLFDGVEGDTFGAEGLVGCAAGSEIDATDPALGTPPHALVVAASEGHTDSMQPMPEDIRMPHPAMSAACNPAIRAEITFFETPGGGAVLSCGSLSWPGAIAHADFGSDVARISENALCRFLDPRPFLPPD